MSRSLGSSIRLGLLVLAAVVFASVDSPLRAQFSQGVVSQAQFGGGSIAVKFREPQASRVYQRDVNGKAEIPIALDESVKDAKVIDARIQGMGMAGVMGTKFVDGKLVGVGAGGPYTISCTLDIKGAKVNANVGPIFVGDLWVLAGQSNMEGVGNLIDVTPPHPKVMLLGMDGKWGQAEEPLHWLIDSPDTVHSGDAKTRAERSARTHKSRIKGAGLGLPFAVSMVESTGIPIGLVACAHGGTSMAQWSPAKKEEGGASLYGSMLRQVKLAGGKVKGVLWYQGESDANPNASKIFQKTFSDFIAAVRADLGQPELPFYYVQIGRFIRGGDSKDWNAVQEAQRVIPERVANTAVISVIDLELDDLIHVGTQGLKRAGQRLARIAERELFGQVGATTPTFERVTPGPNNTLTVKFKGVNMGQSRMMNPGSMGTGMMGGPGMIMSPGDPHSIGLKPERHIAGFSIHKEDGTALPLIFEAAVGKARDTVVLKLTGPVPEKASLWYGYGMDPYCNLVDGLDMAVPVFGPVALDAAASPSPTVAASAPKAAAPAPAPKVAVAAKAPQPAPVKVLIITGDAVPSHDWKKTTPLVTEFLQAGGKIKVDVTTTPSKDLTDENLAKYDVLLLNYKDMPNGPAETRWSEANKKAFLKAVSEGKGLALFHHASSAFIKPNWEEFEKAIAGGWRAQGNHGPKHVFTVKKTGVKHPISDGLPAQFEHKIDELYQNSMILPGTVVLATAYSDPGKPKGSGKDEPIIWINTFGKGRVYENVMGHDAEAISDPMFQEWMRRGVIWAGTGKVD